MQNSLILSPLPHTWLLDLDGTILRHNGYLTAEGDTLLPGAASFLASIPQEDSIIFLTSRPKSAANMTETFLKANAIRFDQIIYDLPFGERILINDAKPSGLQTAYCFCFERDDGVNLKIVTDKSL